MDIYDIGAYLEINEIFWLYWLSYFTVNIMLFSNSLSKTLFNNILQAVSFTAPSIFHTTHNTTRVVF